MLKTYQTLINQNGFAVRNSTHGMKNLEQVSALATKYGLLVPFQNADFINNVTVASRDTIKEMSKLSRSNTFRAVVPDFAKLDANNVYPLLKIYNKCGWKSEYIKQNDEIRRALWAYINADDPNERSNFFKNVALGRSFNNSDGILPRETYTEWDATMLRDDIGRRDAERFVKGASGKIYYTGQHYRSFLRLQ